MRVLNTDTKMKYDEVEFIPLSKDEYSKLFKQFVPDEPFDDPLLDETATFLYLNPVLFLKLLHHKRHYNTYFPVYMDNKTMYPTYFSYSKEFLEFFRTLPKDITTGAVWEKVLPLAILKLTGKFYSSAGAV